MYVIWHMTPQTSPTDRQSAVPWVVFGCITSRNASLRPGSSVAVTCQVRSRSEEATAPESWKQPPTLWSDGHLQNGHRSFTQPSSLAPCPWCSSSRERTDGGDSSVGPSKVKVGSRRAFPRSPARNDDSSLLASKGLS